ncbi:FimV/HubP family polar landmark protein, partial [Celerinatantimonas diazotrophica]
MKRYSSRLAILLFCGLLGLPIISHAAVDPSSYIQMVGPNEAVNSQGDAINQRYGPIQHSDTLWAIANRYRPNSSVSVYQTMVAIFRTNPQAFVGKDMNSLVNGAYISIPTLEQIRAIPSREAQRIVLGQSESSTQTDSTSSTKSAAASKTTRKRSSSVSNQKVSDLTAQITALKKRLDELETMRNKELDVMRKQLDQASEQMLGMSEVNHRLKLRIADLSNQLKAIKDQLSQTSQTQQDILNRLNQNQQAKEQQQASTFNQILKSPLNLALAVCIPLLLILLVVVLILRLRSKKKDKQVELDEEELSLEEVDDQFSKLFNEDLPPTEPFNDIPSTDDHAQPVVPPEDESQDNSVGLSEDSEIAFDDDAVNALAEFEDPEQDQNVEEEAFDDLMPENDFALDDEDVILPSQEDDEPDIDLPGDDDLMPEEPLSTPVPESKPQPEQDELSIDFDQPLPDLELPETEDSTDDLMTQEQQSSATDISDEGPEQPIDFEEEQKPLSADESLLQMDEMADDLVQDPERVKNDELLESQMAEEMAEVSAKNLDEELDLNLDVEESLAEP